MTDSIFDPKSGQTEHSGNVLTPPQADDISHFPPDMKGGKLAKKEAAEQAEAGKDADGIEDFPGSSLEQLARAEREHEEEI